MRRQSATLHAVFVQLGSMQSSTLISRLLPTLYEDTAIVVVSKPAGVDVGGMSTGDEQRGIVELLTELRPELRSLEPVNRLSRYESGVLVLAKTPAAARGLKAAWKSGVVEQDYLAVVIGRPAKRRLTIGGPEEGPAGRLAARTGGRGATPAGRGWRSGRGGRRPAAQPAHLRPGTPHAGIPARAGGADANAVTSVQLVAEGEKRSLVRLRTNAATTHELRAQLRSARLRLAGDHLNDPVPRRAPVEQTFLHLSSASLRSIGADKPILLRAPTTSEPSAYLERAIDVDRFLRAALVRRLPLLAARDTNCLRLISGQAEDLKGVAAERFGEAVIFQVHHGSAADAQFLGGLARWYRDTLGIRTAYAKSFLKGPAREDMEFDAEPTGRRLKVDLGGEKPVLGPPVGEEIIVAEFGIRFSIRPAAGQSVGLFLDQRDNRRRIRQMSEGKDVLNLFAYTCGFSVAAALGGARSTASVDVSPKHLEWGRRNFELNGIVLEIGEIESSGVSPSVQPPHLFFRSDAYEFLKRAQRQGREYDLMILDAPSFAHGRGKREAFSIETDLSKLVRAAVEVLRSGGTMLVSTNYRKLTLEGIRRRIRDGAAGRKVTVVEAPPLPLDFAADPDHAKAVFVRFD